VKTARYVPWTSSEVVFVSKAAALLQQQCGHRRSCSRDCCAPLNKDRCCASTLHASVMQDAHSSATQTTLPLCAQALGGWLWPPEAIAQLGPVHSLLLKVAVAFSLYMDMVAPSVSIFLNPVHECSPMCAERSGAQRAQRRSGARAAGCGEGKGNEARQGQACAKVFPGPQI